MLVEANLEGPLVFTASYDPIKREKFDLENKGQGRVEGNWHLRHST